MRYRPRRLRKSSTLRKLVQEQHVSTFDLVMPLFVVEGVNQRIDITALPGQSKMSPDLLLQECQELWQLGIQAVALFPVIPEERKDKEATEAYNETGHYLEAVRLLKQKLPELTVITDVALDPYSSDGHDGIVNPNGDILNDESLEALAAMALCQARAGADMVAPSDMMDGRIHFIRSALDREGFTQTGIISYAVKYASAFYEPFRQVLASSPKKGDKSTYQMDPANLREALWEARLDWQEGADILLVKPGLAYLDVVREIRSKSLIPLAVYNVSGEYAMLKHASRNGCLDYKRCVLEVLLSFKRAGADLIFTYHAKEAAQWLNESGNSEY